ANGSIAVRRVPLSDERAALKAIDDFITIVATMPVRSETAGCDTTQLILEEYVRGEEFSIEGWIHGRMVHITAIHWKIDIDADPHRFFERTFVTLPRAHKWYKLLEESTKSLVGKLVEKGAKSGVFHAECRVNSERNRVYFLEIGLRPGGGMVSASVRHATNV